MEQKAYSYIRFSSPKQETGDSERRQVELSKQYAKEHGLILDDQLTDRGLSEYNGAHKTKGKLGAFLQLVEQGKIANGSTLIVENLDRLSREQVLDALAQFTSIIKAGIKIITLQDNMEYTNKSINQNWAQLIISISYMARAHDESETKSKRLSATNEKKRKDVRAGEKKFTSRVPAWIKVIESEKVGNIVIVKEFEVIPKYREAIRKMFEWKKNGMGNQKITNELNRLCPRPKSKKNKTHKIWVKPTIGHL